jgi:hypothetical protein
MAGHAPNLGDRQDVGWNVGEIRRVSAYFDNMGLAIQ